MKREDQGCESTNTGPKTRESARSGLRKRVARWEPEVTGTTLRSSRTRITDLPPEMLLEIFSWLSIVDICERVAPVCEQWNILSRHPYLRKELSLSGEHISTARAYELLRSSPHLRSLCLRRRHDTDAILQQLCKSNRRIEKIDIDECRGSEQTLEVNVQILAMTLEVCTGSVSWLDDGHWEFYRTPGRFVDGTKVFRFLSAEENGDTCHLERRIEVREGYRVIPNNDVRYVEKIKGLMSPAFESL